MLPPALLVRRILYARTGMAAWKEIIPPAINPFSIVHCWSGVGLIEPVTSLPSCFSFAISLAAIEFEVQSPCESETSGKAGGA